MDRDTLAWMKELIDRLQGYFEQCQEADLRSSQFLARAINRDLDQFRRLCEGLCQRNVAGFSQCQEYGLLTTYD